jgi:hypothetical protein
MLVIDAYRYCDERPVIQRVFERTVLQHADRAAHALLGVVLHVPHVGLHHTQAKMRHGLGELGGALLAGSHLGAQIGDVLVNIARRVAATAQ